MVSSSLDDAGTRNREQELGADAPANRLGGAGERNVVVGV